MKVANKQNIFSFALSALLLLPLSAPAQDLGEMIFTSGTTWRDASSNDWAYLIWQATDLPLLMGQTFAIYRKDAAPDTPGIAFERVGLATRQTDPRVIAHLISRATHLGEDETALEEVINQLFQDIVPVSSLTLPEKLAAVLDGAYTDARLFENLVFLARNHPAIALSLGIAFAISLDTPTATFEVRLLDPVTDAPGAVVGRVVLEAGTPAVLPAPVELKLVEDGTAQGHLNIKLQWRTPEALRRLSLLQYGYNLYRMTFDYAATHNYDSIPPAPAILAALAQTTNAVLVNHIPILIDEDSMTTNTFFAADDNRAGSLKSLSFADGESFVYFVTARDLLGRDGLVSTGLVVTVCDRRPPRVPSAVKASIEYAYAEGRGTQSVRIAWNADTSTNLSDRATRYYIYRWESIAEMQASAADPLAGRIGGPLPHQPGRMGYVDATLPETAKGTTYWYTVRSADSASCGENLSGNSAPAHATLRDREGPRERPGSRVWINCATLETDFDSARSEEPEFAYLLYLQAHRNTNWIAWVEFAWYGGAYQGTGSVSNATKLGRFDYTGDEIEIPLDLPRTGEQQHVTVFCRAGTAFGKISDWEHYSGQVPSSGHTQWRFVNVGTITRTPAGDACARHIARPSPETTPKFGQGILLDSDVPASGAVEWRFFRRIGYGPMTLIAQGLTEDAMTINYEDVGAMHDAAVCYFRQFFDEHGNPGPLDLIACIEVTGLLPLPQPILQPLASSGDEATQTRLIANWFCAPAEVDHFEVAVARSDDLLPNTMSPALSPNILGNTLQHIHVILPDGSSNTLAFAIYRTGRIGAQFGDGDHPVFSAELDVEPGKTYHLMIRPRGANGGYGEWSNLEAFRWTPHATSTAPEVPWPPRPLPEILSVFNENIAAHYLSVTQYPAIVRDRVGILIGEMPLTNYTGNANYGGEQGEVWFIELENALEPVHYLFAGPGGEQLMPFALYRQAVANDDYPDVSGDIYQVSPLMETIAYETGAPPVNIILRDPFIMALPRPSANKALVYMLDTQPLIRGASYQYSLLRFGTDREIQTITPIPAIQIPE